MAELNEQMLRAIIMDIMDEVGMLKDEPVQATPKEPKLKDLIRQMLVDMQRS